MAEANPANGVASCFKTSRLLKLDEGVFTWDLILPASSELLCSPLEVIQLPIGLFYGSLLQTILARAWLSLILILLSKSDTIKRQLFFRVVFRKSICSISLTVSIAWYFYWKGYFSTFFYGPEIFLALARLELSNLCPLESRNFARKQEPNEEPPVLGGSTGPGKKLGHFKPQKSFPIDKNILAYHPGSV